MKTMLKVALVVALFAMANTLFASGNLKVNLVPLSGEKALIAISSLSNSNFQITLTDEKNQIVYYKETSEPDGDYRKVYNFSDLEPGAYKLTVVCDNLTTERKFQKTYHDLKVGEERTTLEPFFSYKDGLLRCSYLNFQKENVTLYFYGTNGIMYSKEIGRDFKVEEGLNLSKLQSGTYEVVLSTRDNTYSYLVKK